MSKLLDVAVKQISRKQVLRQVENSRKPLFVVTLNPEILLHAWRNKEYRDILNSADIRVADGIGIVFVARLLYGVKLERFPGADLANEILKWTATQDKRMFILGGTKEVNKKAVERIKNNEWRIKNVEGLGGKFTEKEAVQRISAFNPDILFVALGAPKQEIFIHKLKATSYKLKAITIGIGGAIDYWAYPWLRAPYIVRQVGLEWLWRLALQPWRLPRILKAVIVFPLACLYDWILLKWRNERH